MERQWVRHREIREGLEIRRAFVCAARKLAESLCWCALAVAVVVRLGALQAVAQRAELEPQHGFVDLLDELAPSRCAQRGVEIRADLFVEPREPQSQRVLRNLRRVHDGVERRPQSRDCFLNHLGRAAHERRRRVSHAADGRE
eukprot:Amastigsp_a342879_4.p2 type:complete len:143 gc:universal Amastigsp_a342879_4:321-749(+)